LMKLNKLFDPIIKDLNIIILSRWLLYSVLIGIVGGMGAIVFSSLLGNSTKLFSEYLGGYVPPAPAGEIAEGMSANSHPYWWLFLIPALGGLIAGIIVYVWAPEAEGHGTDAVIDSFHRLRGRIRKRVPIIKTIASVITIGSGGSAGREGPIAQIGAGFGSFLASTLKLTVRDKRLMVIAGTAAGIGSIFRSPLGGALFATEVAYRDPEFESEGIIPAIISSIVGYSVFATFYGWRVIFDTPQFHFQQPQELFFYGILGFICAIVGIFYIKFFYWLRNIFRTLPFPNHFKPALGGLMLGIVALFIPHIWGGGYGWVQLAIYGKLGIGLMVTIALAKIVATSFTISSGGSGGVFAPSLMIGAMIGGAFGQICHTFFPNIVTQPNAFVLVGMGGFFAGVAKVPIASLIMVCEMAGSYGLLAPLMLVSAIGYLLIPRSLSIYESQVDNRVDSPAHRGDFFIDVLEQLKVKNALIEKKEVVVIPENMPLRYILDLVTKTTYSYFPVVDNSEDIIGIIPMGSIRRVLLEEGVLDIIIASDLAITAIETVTMDEDLNSVLRKLTLSNFGTIPVVQDSSSRKVIAMLSRRELLMAYDKEIQKVRSH